MRRCVNCGRRRPKKRLTEMLDGGIWRCTVRTGECISLHLGGKRRDGKRSPYNP